MERMSEKKELFKWFSFVWMEYKNFFFTSLLWSFNSDKKISWIVLFCYYGTICQILSHGPISFSAFYFWGKLEKGLPKITIKLLTLKKTCLWFFCSRFSHSDRDFGCWKSSNLEKVKALFWWVAKKSFPLNLLPFQCCELILKSLSFSSIPFFFFSLKSFLALLERKGLMMLWPCVHAPSKGNNRA